MQIFQQTNAFLDIFIQSFLDENIICDSAMMTYCDVTLKD